jgi:tetratricopeptide (TPR) repeat protein
MTEEDEKGNEEELVHTGEAEIEGAEVSVEKEALDEEEPEAEQPSLPSDADPFLLHMLRCEDLLERLSSSLASQEDLNQHVHDAFGAINEREYEAALTALDEAREEEGHNPLIPLLSAVAGLKQGDTTQAAIQCEAALAINALDPDAWLCKAATDVADRRFSDACDHLSTAVEITPDDIGLLISQGVCFIRLGRFDEAIRILYRAQKNDRSNIRAWVNKGIAYAYTNRLKDALNCFNEALVLDPDNSDARAAKEEMRRRLAH